MNTLVVAGLGVVYGKRTVVSDFTFTVAAGEVVALMGPSGSGKSSIINCVAGIQKPNAGEVRVGSKVISAASLDGRSTIRRDLIGISFQDPALLPELTVAENVALTELFEGVPRAEAIEHARASLASVGMSSHASKRIDEISGGEAQRISIARALVRASVILLVADEPTASLDAVNACAIGQLIVDQAKERQIAALVATHDLSVASRCDRVVSLRSEQ